MSVSSWSSSPSPLKAKNIGSGESSMVSTKMNSVYKPRMRTFVIPEPLSRNDKISINENVSFEEETTSDKR